MNKEEFLKIVKEWLDGERGWTWIEKTRPQDWLVEIDGVVDFEELYKKLFEAKKV